MKTFLKQTAVVLLTWGLIESGANVCYAAGAPEVERLSVSVNIASTFQRGLVVE